MVIKFLRLTLVIGVKHNRQPYQLIINQVTSSLRDSSLGLQHSFS